jgi:cytochrome P450
VHPGGIQAEGCNAPIPQYTRIALPAEAIQYDDAIYANAHVYDPFRFAQRSEPHPDSRFRNAINVNKSTVTLDDSFLSFGVPGRWACPGRFFALLELKIFAAHLLLNYDVEFLAKRPGPIYIAWARYPRDARIRIRRRVDGTGA